MTLFRAVSNISDWRAVVGAIPDAQLLLERGRLTSHIGFERYIPKTLQRIIAKACHADPAKRFQTAKAFCQKLDRLRFGTDWIRMNDYEWQGFAAGDAFTCSLVANRMECVITKNARRQNALCKLYTSLSEAASAVEEHIAETTLLGAA